jgi:hypothetical protein
MDLGFKCFDMFYPLFEMASFDIYDGISGNAVNIGQPLISQWEFQDPKMEVPTIYKAYIRPM